MPSASYKAKLFHKNVSRNFNLDDLGISLPVFPSRTNLKLHNILSQEYPVNAGVFQGSILGSTLFLVYSNDLPDDLPNIAVYTNDTTLDSKCDQASGLGQNLELSFQLEPDLWDTGLGQEMTCWLQFQKKTTGSSAINVKIDGSVLEEK